MRLEEKDISSWSTAKEKLLRHMFILDLIRDFNKFYSETMITWLLAPSKDKETWDKLHGIIEKHKRSALYTIFTEEEREKYDRELVNSDDAILARVANL